MSSRGRSRARSGFRGMASSFGSSHQQQREQSEIEQPKQEEEIRSQISELSIQGILNVFFLFELIFQI